MSTRHFSNLIDANDVYPAIQQSIGVGPELSYVCWNPHLPVSMQRHGISDIVCDNYVFASGKTFRLQSETNERINEPEIVYSKPFLELKHHETTRLCRRHNRFP